MKDSKLFEILGLVAIVLAGYLFDFIKRYIQNKRAQERQQSTFPTQKENPQPLPHEEEKNIEQDYHEPAYDEEPEELYEEDSDYRNKESVEKARQEISAAHIVPPEEHPPLIPTSTQPQPQPEVRQDESSLFNFDQGSIINGIIFSEIISLPKAKKPKIR